MRTQFLLALIASQLFLTSCQTTQVNKHVSLIPKWIESAAKYCEPKGLLCASAQASSSTQADLQAKSQLLAIFETQINSEVSSQKSLSQSDDFLNDFDLKESIQKNVREKVSIAMEGVEILERKEINGQYYSMAAIDRLKTARLLREQRDKHDERLSYLYSTGKKVSIKKMKEHYIQREEFDKKLSVLSLSRKSPVSLSQIDKLKSVKMTSGHRILLKLEMIEDSLADKVRGYLTGLGYQVVLDGSPYDYKIIGEMKKKREFFKVKGFEKFSYTFNLKNYHPNNSEVGGFSVNKSGIGRSERDAFKQVESYFNKYIENNLEELRLGEK